MLRMVCVTCRAAARIRLTESHTERTDERGRIANSAHAFQAAYAAC